MISEPSNEKIYAIFPSPVNDDVCFAAAGHRDFYSEDEHYSEAYWDEQAEVLHQKIWAVLSGLGQAVLCSPPLYAPRSRLKFWQRPVPLPLIEQLALPMWQDHLPAARVRFGQAVEIETGRGHCLYWLRLLPDCPRDFATLWVEITAAWTVQQVQLDWEKLR
jgi:hypothetical protein